MECPPSEAEEVQFYCLLKRKKAEKIASVFYTCSALKNKRPCYCLVFTLICEISVHGWEFCPDPGGRSA